MGGTPKQGMKFSCDQRWEDMAPQGNDRFCLSCQKPVIDFTTWDRTALIAYFKERPDTCGQFRAEQVDPSLIPLGNPTRPWRSGFLAAVAALAITTGRAQDAMPPAATTEQAPVPASHDTGTGIHDKWGPEIGIKADGPYCKKLEPISKAPPRRRVFVSGLFPFLHIRERMRRGKIRITGCPSF